MAASTSKKRKYEDENRGFRQEWEEKFVFIERNGKPFCLICSSVLNHFKQSNLKRHYETNHKHFHLEYPPDSEIRSHKINSLKSSSQSQMTMFTAFSKEADVTTEASYALAWNIARSKHPYNDGEFIKDNLVKVVSILDPNNTKLQRLISQMALSRQTIVRRITDLSANVTLSLKNDLVSSVAFSVALDESTDIQDNPQLAVFVRYVSTNFEIKEELLDLVALRDTTKGVDVKNALDCVFSDNIPPECLSKLVSVSTDGAPAMVGKHCGMIALMMKDSKYPNFFPIHCVIHREHLAAKYFKFEHVMKPVLEIVNFIRSNAKNHRQFRNFVEELEEDEIPKDLNYYCIVRWLSTSNVLKRFVNLFEPICAFLTEKGKNYQQLSEIEWKQDLMFFTDGMNHLQTLNLSLQGKGKIVSDLAQTIFSFQTKIKLFQRDLSTKALQHFPLLKSIVDSDHDLSKSKINLYSESWSGVSTNFASRFSDLENLKPTFAFLVNPFVVDVVKYGSPVHEPFVSQTANMEAELVDLQEDFALKAVHQTESTVEFWKHVSDEKYPTLRKTSQRLLSVFGTTYACESMYSTMKYVKSKNRAVLTNQHLKELLQTATTSYEPNFKKMLEKIETHKSTGK